MSKKVIEAIALVSGACAYSALRLLVFPKGGLIPVTVAAVVYTAAHFGLKRLFLEEEQLTKPEQEA